MHSRNVRIGLCRHFLEGKMKIMEETNRLKSNITPSELDVFSLSLHFFYLHGDKWKYMKVSETTEVEHI